MLCAKSLREFEAKRVREQKIFDSLFFDSYICYYLFDQRFDPRYCYYYHRINERNFLAATKERDTFLYVEIRQDVEINMTLNAVNPVFFFEEKLMKDLG